MSSTEIGRAAEVHVCNYLVSLGYTIIICNWRTRYCEIDIVAGLNHILYFVEVKSRKSDHFGDGIDYITAKKMAQMRLGARLFVQINGWTGAYQLAAAGVTAGKITYIPDIS